MQTANLRRRKWDRGIILPILVIFAQNIPWIANRIRLRMLAPFLLLYVVYEYTTTSGLRINLREKKHAIRLMVSFFLFFIAYFLSDWLYYREFNNPVFVVFVFSIFYLWVFIRLSMMNKLLEIKIITITSLIAIFIGVLIASRFMSDESARDLIRASVAGSISNADASELILAGVGGYGQVYSVGLLLPPILYAVFKTKKAMRIFLVLVFLFSSLFIFRAGFSIILATMLFGLCGYGISFLIRRYTFYRFALLAAITISLALTIVPQLISFMADPIVGFAEHVENINYKARLVSVADVLSGYTDDYAMERTGLMWKSWEVFKKKPIIGASYADGLLGGHSFTFDYLAKGGLLFFTPYLVFFYYYFRYMNFIIFSRSRSARILIITFFYMYVFCTFLNPLNSATVWASFFMILPGLSLFFSDTKQLTRVYNKGHIVSL